MQFNISDVISLIGVPAVVAAGIIAVARTWMSTRLSESIKHEYGQALQEHKRQQDEKLQDQKLSLDTRLQDQKGLLDAKLQEITHANQIGQLRTSLFFNHQQTAFKAILTQTAFIIESWWQNYNPETYIAGPVPREAHEALRMLVRDNQLFLDADCTLVLGILTNVYRRSMPFNDGSGAPSHLPDGRKPLDDAEFLQSRIASVFQMKIGVTDEREAYIDVALFGTVRFLQEHRLGVDHEIVKYLVDDSLFAEDFVGLARLHWSELSHCLTTILESLRADGWLAYIKLKQLERLTIAVKNLG